MKKLSLLITALMIFCTNASASDYHLFNPVPKNKLKPIAVDRPSKSDAVQTLDAGHFMVETSFFNYKSERENNNEREDFDFFTSLTFRLGLTQNQEIQLFFDSYKYSRQNNPNLDERDGFGDITLRLKHNIFGNGEGKYGLTLIPFLKIPTNQNNLGNDHHESGVTFPFIANFDDYSLTLQTGFSLVRDNADHEAAYTNIVTLSHNFNAKLSTFVEAFFFKSELENSKWQNTLDFGLSYNVTPNFVLDGAVNFGVSEHADDFEFLTGAAYRF